MTVLAVRREGETAYFYLDKPVCLPAGREFAILPYQTECSVRLAQPAGAQLEVLEPVTAAENLKLGDRLREHIVGQDEAIDAVCAAIKRSRVGLQAKRKPVSFIFVGGTGVGKTELVKRLAADLFNSPESLIRLDMSEFMEKFSVSRIIGSGSSPRRFAAGRTPSSSSTRLKRPIRTS